MESTYRRINITIAEEHYQTLNEQGINVSGLIRDLIGDHLSDNVITLQVSEETRKIYDTVVSNTGSSDVDLEAHFRQALAKLLQAKITDMTQLHARLLEEQAAD